MHVERQAAPSDVIEVERQLPLRLRIIPSIHLRQARQTPGRICSRCRNSGNRSTIFATNSGRSGRGPTKDICPRKMFSSCGSSSIAVLRSSRPMRVMRGIVLRGQHRARHRFRVLHHGAKLIDAERPAPPPHPDLRVEGREPVFSPDRHDDGEDEEGGEQQPHPGHQDIQETLERVIRSPGGRGHLGRRHRRLR